MVKSLYASAANSHRQTSDSQLALVVPVEPLIQTSVQSPSPGINPERWVEEYGDVLFGFAAARVRDPAIAKDLVQETFLAAIKAREAFGGRSSERGWLFAH